MFNPITASQEIKDAFTDYITTTFDFADPDYADELKKSIQESGAVAKGPYLEVSGSYESGESIAELIAEHKVSPLFDTLENCAEKDKELKIQRGLYLHQIAALEKANARKNLVVTTGTGSGKTECFLIPVIDSLLKEEEAGTLNDAVRAIIIYPMNALANDQIKRLQKLLKDHPTIRFGLYNGNTEQTKDRALAEYQRVNGRNAHPLPNEVICRDEMQTNPPHILITNYSMLEYMMLRPKDDKVFSGAQLRYIVLDEAHIYKGATGMETSLLMRRLRARISTPGSVQYILTSATLGGYDADDDIIAFASRLCGAPFLRENIIRSKEKQPALKDTWKIPNQLFTEIAENKRVPSEVLADYGFTMDAADEDERLFELLLHSPLFGAVRGICSQSGPLSVNELLQKLADRQFTLSKEELVAFINVCTRAEKGKVSLIKARYHFFVRALEGAYITLNTPKQLFLQRKLFTGNGSQQQAVFECAICTDCGRTAIVGKTIGDHLENVKQWDDKAEYYLVKEQGEAHIFDEDDDEEAVTIDDETGCAENDYVICPICGAISGEADAKLEAPCDHAASNYIKLSKVTVKNTKQIKCSACGFGHLRRFYLGAEAATSVLGTKLFDILPETEETPIPKENRTSGRGLFAARNTRTTTTTTKHRQFLCFSDSRSEAAFFACYMEKSYQEFLRRRGIWHVIEECKKEGKTFLSVSSFVERLSRYFNANKTFAEWDQPENQDIDLACKRNAWIAVLNEMYEQPTAVINGAAGTGKTMVAVEKARRHSVQGDSVLFLCFNRMLRDHLNQQYKSGLLKKDFENVDFMTISALAYKVAGDMNGLEDLEQWLSDCYDKKEVFGYKHVIVDEGQDFGLLGVDDSANEDSSYGCQIIDILELVALGNGGTFYLFCDRNQIVQGAGADAQLPACISDSECKLTLHRNCRNTYEIATTSIKPLPKNDRNITAKQGPKSGIKPHMYAIANSDEQIEYINKAIDSLKDTCESITILSVKNTLNNSILSPYTECESVGDYSRHYTHKGKECLFSNCSKFKGLEADAIILIDVDSSTFDKGAMYFYVGASRARRNLEIISNATKEDCALMVRSLNPKAPLRRDPISMLKVLLSCDVDLIE